MTLLVSPLSRAFYKARRKSQKRIEIFKTSNLTAPVVYCRKFLIVAKHKRERIKREEVYKKRKEGIGTLWVPEWEKDTIKGEKMRPARLQPPPKSHACTP